MEGRSDVIRVVVPIVSFAVAVAVIMRMVVMGHGGNTDVLLIDPIPWNGGTNISGYNPRAELLWVCQISDARIFSSLINKRMSSPATS